MLFEICAVALALLAVAVLLRNYSEDFARLSFSFIDFLVDLLAPMEELLSGT